MNVKRMRNQIAVWTGLIASGLALSLAPKPAPAGAEIQLFPAPGPLLVEDPATIYFDDQLWIFGGTRQGEVTDQIWSSPGDSDWTYHTTKSLPTPLTNPQVVEHEGRLLLIPSSGSEGAIWASNTGLDWEEIAPPGTLADADWRFATVQDGEIYIVSDVDGSRARVQRSSNGVEWEIIWEMVLDLEKPMSLESFDGKLALFGLESVGEDAVGDYRIITWISVGGIGWVRREHLPYFAVINGEHQPLYRSLELSTTVWNDRLWVLDRGNPNLHHSHGINLELISTPNLSIWTRHAPQADNLSNPELKPFLHGVGDTLIAGSTHQNIPAGIHQWSTTPGGHAHGGWTTLANSPTFTGISADFARIYARGDRLWKLNNRGLHSSDNGVTWRPHGGPTMLGGQATFHNGAIHITRQSGNHYRAIIHEDPFEVTIEELDWVEDNSNLISHNGYLWISGHSVTELRAVSCFRPQPPFNTYPGSSVRTTLDGTVFRSIDDGESWETFGDNSLPSYEAQYVHFAGHVWGIGGIDFTDVQVHCHGGFPQSSYFQEFRNEIRWMDENGEWIVEGTLPEEITSVQLAHNLNGSIYMVANNNHLYRSQDMLNWELLAESIVPEDIGLHQIAFFRNRLWLYGASPNSGPVIWKSGPLDSIVSHDFGEGFAGWNFRSRFAEVTATIEHDSVNRQARLYTPRVSDHGFAALKGPRHEPASDEHSAGASSGYPLPVSNENGTAGDRYFRVEAAAQALAGTPWFRIRTNSQDFERASEVTITTLGNEKAIHGTGLPTNTFSAIINVPTTAQYFTPSIDLITNTRNENPGTLGLEGVRFTEWTPPAAETLSTVSSYTFSEDTGGFTPRHTDALAAPVAQYQDERGLVIRGADSPTTDNVIFGWWGKETDITLQGGTVYKTTWRLGSNTPVENDVEVPVMRLRINESEFRKSPVLTIVSQRDGRLPLQDRSEEYVLWFEVPAALDGANLILSFDLLATPDDVVRRPDREVWLEGLQVEVSGP
ncbi:MAG: hypothetical protein JJU11_12180 [Candidatus Sumerlaeia bacterium]|nr:hypothetical protein [Candidatus Sumerlaeia bacterium]